MLSAVALGCQLITPRALRWLQECQHGHVLHVSDRACNLADEQGRVLALVSPPLEPGPFSLVLGGSSSLRLGATAPVRVDRESRRLVIGRLAFTYGAARCWAPRPDWAALRRTPPEPRADLKLPPEIARLLNNLLDGISARDLTRVRAAARSLAGRGIGLTPTGDDVLAGVLHALWVWRPDQTLLQAISRSAAPHTTMLSAAFLHAAAAGEATRAWCRLAGGDASAVAAILATGHSSGREAWAAYVTTWLRLAGERD